MRIKRIENNNIGREHNELAEVGRRLSRDGEDALAERYFKRAQASQEIFVHLTGIGDEAISVSKESMHSHQRGVEIANWLLTNGWTAPEWLPVTDEPIPADSPGDCYYF